MGRAVQQFTYGSAAPRSMVLDGSGNIYITGSTINPNPHIVDGTAYYHDDYVTLKYDPGGTLLWASTYDGPASSSDGASDIAVDGAGNVYVTGGSFGLIYADAATIKYDGEGNQLWVARYRADGCSAGGVGIAVDIDRSVHVISEGCGTFKYDEHGSLLWVAPPAVGPHGLEVDGSGNTYVTGSAYSGEASGNDVATVKYDPNGVELWAVRYGTPAAGSIDTGTAIEVDSAGNIFVAGTVQWDTSQETNAGFDMLALKYNTDGQLSWAYRYDGPGGGYYEPVMAIDSAGSVNIAGSPDASNGQEDFATLKIDSSGNQLWVQRYDGPQHLRDEVYSLAADANGNVYVGGTTDTTGISDTGDYVTIKYDSQGNQRWLARYDGGQSGDFLRGVAVDGEGNVVVTGLSIKPPRGNFDTTTIKYVTDLALDGDNDGVPDNIDTCPLQPGPASNDGCPVTAVGGSIGLLTDLGDTAPSASPVPPRGYLPLAFVGGTAAALFVLGLSVRRRKVP